MLICEDSQEAAATERCLENEIRSVRSMKVAEIKRELSQRGLATDDMIEKEEFVRCLAQARASEVSVLCVFCLLLLFRCYGAFCNFCFLFCVLSV